MDDAELTALATQVGAYMVADLDDPSSTTRKFIRRVVAVEVAGELHAIRQDLNNALLAVERAGADRGERLAGLEAKVVATMDTVGRLDHQLGEQGRALRHQLADQARDLQTQLGSQANELKRIADTLADGRSGMAWLLRVGKIAAIVVGSAGAVIAALTAATAWVWQLINHAPPPGAGQ